MENKVIIEGTLLSVPKLTEFDSTLIRIKNSRSFKKKDGSMQELTFTASISARGATAKIIVERFKKGDNIRVEGNLTNKDTKKVDEEGNAIWQTWINAYKVDAMVLNENLAPLPEKLQTTPATQRQNQAFEAAKSVQPQRQPTPVFKKQVNTYEQRPLQRPAPQQLVDDEDPFGDRNGNPLPFQDCMNITGLVTNRIALACSGHDCTNDALIQVISTLNRTTNILGSAEKMRKDQRHEWEDWYCEKCFLKLENKEKDRIISAIDRN